MLCVLMDDGVKGLKFLQIQSGGILCEQSRDLGVIIQSHT